MFLPRLYVFVCSKLKKCVIKNRNIPVYVGGGIDKKNVSKILKQVTPFGLDISRSLKNERNLISKSKLKDFLNQISVG